MRNSGQPSISSGRLPNKEKTMFRLWIRLMVVAALLELGISFSDFKDCRSRECVKRTHAKTLKVLDVDWKSISVFPEEAKRFR